MSAGAYACARCGRRYPAPGDCPRCPDMALLDIGKPDLREMLVEEDRRRVERRSDLLRYAAVPIGMALGILLIVAWPDVLILILPLPLPIPAFVRAVAVMSVIAGVAWFALGRLLPAKRHFADLE